MFINKDGIDYEQDILHKYNKSKHAIGIIKWTGAHSEFRSGFKQFYKSCIMPILGYGCELYNPNNLVALEKIRIALYRFYELKNQYLSVPLYRKLKLISLNKQLAHLNITLINTDIPDKKAVYAANKERVDENWNKQPTANRASNFSKDKLIIKNGNERKKHQAAYLTNLEISNCFLQYL